jgi:hypothetical protein
MRVRQCRKATPPAISGQATNPWTRSDTLVTLPPLCSYVGLSDWRQWRNEPTNDHGWEDARDDYVVLDEEKSVGRIHKDTTSPRWIWSVNTSPFPAPPPNNGLAPTLEEAKLEFKARYEEMKRMGVRPFS